MARRRSIAALLLLATLLPGGEAPANPGLHDRLLDLVLPRLQARLAGELTVGRLGGGLANALTLDDVELRDAEGAVALHADRVSARYSLAGLVRKQVRIESLIIEGLTVRARRLRDGRLNLAALTRPSPKREGGGDGFTFEVAAARVRGQVRFEPPEGAAFEAALALEGHARLGGDETELGIEALRLAMSRPAQPVLEAQGTVRIDAGGQVSLAQTSVLVRGDGRDLLPLVRGLDLELERAPLAARLRADGPLTALALDVQAILPRGVLTLDGQLGVREQVAWRGQLRATGVDPGALVRGAPHGTLTVAAHGQGQAGRGEIALEQLRLAIVGASVSAHGQVTLGERLLADADAEVDARDLRPLAALLGQPRALAGQLRAKVHLQRTRAHDRLDAELNGRGLSLPAAQLPRIDRLEGRVHALDLGGSAILVARGVRASPGGQPIALDSLDVAASGDRRTLALTVEGRGPHGVELALAAHGAPLPREGRFAAALTLDRLMAAYRGQRWETPAPGRLRITPPLTLSGGPRSGPESKGLELALALRSTSDASSGAPEQQLSCDLQLGANGALQLTVSGHKLDARRLALFAPRPIALPATQLDLEARVRGRLARPTVDLELRGRTAPLPQLDQARARLDLEAHLADARLRADLDLQAGQAHLTARAELPTRDEDGLPIRLDLDAHRIVLEELRPLLPARLRSLTGRADARARVWGTTNRPQLDGELDLPRVGVTGLSRSQARLDLGYTGQRLTARLTAQLAGDQGQAGGVSLDLEAPLDLTRRRRAKLLERLAHELPLEAHARLDGLDLQRLPLASFGLAVPVARGVIDGELDARGTAHAPTLALRLDARNLSVRELEQLDLQLEARYSARALDGRVQARLRGAPVLNGTLASTIDLSGLVDRGLAWRDAPLTAEATIPSVDLARFHGLGGVLDGTLAVRGTLGAPKGHLELEAHRLRLGDSQFPQVTARAQLDEQQIAASLDAVEVGRGRLTAQARVPLDPAQPLSASLSADELTLAASGLGPLRTVRGRLDADLRLDGPRATARLDGSLRLSDGAFAAGQDPRVYRDVELELRARAGELEIPKLQVKVATGSLVGHGRLRLAGVTPASLELTAEAQKFPFWQGNYGAWLDAHVEARGERKGGLYVGTVTLSKATAQLPKIGGAKKLQPTGALEDVVFVDEAAQRRRRAEARASEGAPAGAEVIAHFPGPFHIRSPEGRADAEGELDIKLVGGVPRIYGHAEVLSGNLDLLGRRFKIERVRAGFDGQVALDPAIDIRLTRDISDATIVVELHGTARKPKLQLSSDPPIYDQSQLIGIIVSGDPGSSRIAERSTDQKVVGALSGLLVNKIKDQLGPGLPIDVIKVESGEAGEGPAGLGSTRLEVGKYLTDSIYVSYVHQFGTTVIGLRRLNANEANLEYRFLRHYELATRFGDASAGAVDFYWSYRF